MQYGSWLQKDTGGIVALVLQAAIEGEREGEAGKLYAAVLADALMTHFLRRYTTSRASLHQYVITCRREEAKRLLAETDMPLSEIGPEVGGVDQSHFTALFRKHVSMPPKSTETPH